MKTELEWFIVSENLPENYKKIIVRLENPAWIKPAYECAFFSGSAFEIPFLAIFLKSNNFSSVGYKITHWAYVNLPEEEEEGKAPEFVKCQNLPCIFSRYETLDEIKEQISKLKGGICYCGVCGKHGNGNYELVEKHIEKCLHEKKDEVGRGTSPGFVFHFNEISGKKHFTCGKCSQASEMDLICENCSNDGWIWPLEQLPEEGQKVEVKVLGIDEHIKCYLDQSEFYKDSLTIVPNVIAWRPLKEEKKPEARKPDFSKLKEGDLIFIDSGDSRNSVGYFGSFNLGFIIMNSGDSYQGYNFCLLVDKIKKIIRINIGKKMTQKELSYNPDYYPFEEI